MADHSSWLNTSTPVAHNVPLKSHEKVENVCFSENISAVTPRPKREPQTALPIAQRTRALFNIITRPPLLHTPSLGINLPFESSTGVKTSDFDKISKELKELACSDPCFVSIDGLLDGVLIVRNAIEQLYDDCVALQENKPSDRMVSTINVLDFFLNRVDPILRKLIDLRVSLNDFTLGEVIGRGACGVVRVVHEKNPPNSVFAMKSQYKGSWLYHDPEGAQLLLERTVLAQAAMTDNPWLPHLHYAFQDETQLHLVMDYEPGGDMYIFLSKAAHLLDSEMIQFYAAEIVEATHSLHQMGYIHCDIKPENFAIERSGHLKLIDFGSAIRLNSDGTCVCPTMVGTKEYLNIELLTQRKRGSKNPLYVGPGYDYWAIGVFIYEMYYAQTPFYDEDDDRMMENIINFRDTLNFPTNVNIPPCARDLIRRLVCEPSERLTYEGIVRHPFFQDIDFATIREHTPPYLPPVGELDDVANFSGGGARSRDELLHDISSDKTISPSRGLPPSTPCPGIRGNQQQRLSSLENVEPRPTAPPPAVEPSKKAMQRQAILEAAAMPITEDVQEVVDIEWKGPVFAIDLPFVGFTFTPAMLIGESRSRQTQFRAISRHHNIADSSVTMQSRLSMLDTSCLGEEATARIMEVRRRNRFLEKQITLQEEEIQKLRQRLQASIYSADILSDLDSAVTSNVKHQADEKQELVRLEARVNSLTLEKSKLAEELTETRKCLLDFNNLKDLLNSVDRKAVDEAQSLKVKLDTAEENNRVQAEELTQVRQQLERLRNNNTKLVAERDAALERAAKAEDTAASQADEAEAARFASHCEIVRLTTTTEQQGKLINHLLALLPAEHRQAVRQGILAPVSSNTSEPPASSASLVSSGGCERVRGAPFVRSQSRWLGGSGGTTKSSAGHSALFLKTRSLLRGKRAVAASQKSSAVLGEALDQKWGAAFKSAIGFGGSQGAAACPSSSQKQTRRRRGGGMPSWVRTLSTLRSKKHLTAQSGGFRLHERSFSEGDVDGGVYVGDDASLEYPPLEVDCVVSDVDYFRGSNSTTSSPRSSIAPSLTSLPESSRKVMWAGDLVPRGEKPKIISSSDTHKYKSPHPKLLKQLSRVLGRGKPRNDDGNPAE
ncbi:unnamed protein product [Mesocestoides corti]|uniref:Protein kinase domain-containing protein n=2 Tax=Mesocestoides corti TaxID=53468 RepID=A0A0R3U807_MESCO|nr:unnamed protein product [Mesocestoides corti]